MGSHCGGEPDPVTREILNIEGLQASLENQGVPEDPELEERRQALLNPEEPQSLSRRVVTAAQNLFRVALD